MDVTIFDDVVQTDYGQFMIAWVDKRAKSGMDSLFAGQSNGWVGAAVSGVVHIILARRSGSSVRIERHPTEPPLGSEWEDVVEVSIDIAPSAAVHWMTFDTRGDLDIPPGVYRLRVSARGRDAAHEPQTDDRIVDFYLLQLWPASARPDEVVREGSRDAGYWNGVWASRRTQESVDPAEGS